MTKAKVKIDSTKPYDPNLPCPACNEAVQVYLPPERSVGGPAAYPALLLHYEARRHDQAPPPPPADDEWDPAPPAPADWRPLDKARAERGLPQPDGVWPPVRVAEMPL